MLTSHQIPEPPVTSFAQEWVFYRYNLRSAWDRGLLDHGSWMALTAASYELEAATRTVRQSPAEARPSRLNSYIPRPGAPVILNGANLRRAAVLALLRIRHATTAGVHDFLTQKGFIILGKRPEERVRKALVLECRGTALRPPSVLRSSDGSFSAPPTMLNERTRQRWQQQFPSIAT
jgi:hypothetical protein